MLKRELEEESANVGILPTLARKMPGRFPLKRGTNKNNNNNNKKIHWGREVFDIGMGGSRSLGMDYL
jgi:hypothetical protein